MKKVRIIPDDFNDIHSVPEICAQYEKNTRCPIANALRRAGHTNVMVIPSFFKSDQGGFFFRDSQGGFENIMRIAKTLCDDPSAECYVEFYNS